MPEWCRVLLRDLPTDELFDLIEVSRKNCLASRASPALCWTADAALLLFCACPSYRPHCARPAPVPPPIRCLLALLQDAAAVRFRECENACLMRVAWRIKEMDEDTAMNTFALDCQWSGEALSEVSTHSWPQLPHRVRPLSDRCRHTLQKMRATVLKPAAPTISCACAPRLGPP